MNAKLVVVSGETQSAEYAIALPAIIGRSRQANLTLGHPLVSRKHCELFESEGLLMVRDLGSLNGTFVGETRITSEAPLGAGGLLTVGPVTFQAVYEQSRAIPTAAAVAAVAAGEPGFSARRTREIEQTTTDPLPSGEETPPRAASATLTGGQSKDEATLQFTPAGPLDAAESSTADAETEPFSLPTAGDSSPDLPDDFEVLDFEDPQPASPAPAQPAAPSSAANGTAAPNADGDFELTPPAGEAGAAKQPQDDDLDDFFKSLGMN